ncbi:hypothetical protein BC628DRAFT_451690 [Trametes gibbosa]|nr:hypothetical protein BC628DRAFT_451690 [Trametes gibbosa]
MDTGLTEATDSAETARAPLPHLIKRWKIASQDRQRARPCTVCTRTRTRTRTRTANALQSTASPHSQGMADQTEHVTHSHSFPARPVPRPLWGSGGPECATDLRVPSSGAPRTGTNRERRHRIGQTQSRVFQSHRGSAPPYARLTLRQPPWPELTPRPLCTHRHRRTELMFFIQPRPPINTNSHIPCSCRNR